MRKRFINMIFRKKMPERLSGTGNCPDHSGMTRIQDANADLARRDLRHIWHPCTQMHDHEQVPMVPIVRGEGAWLVGATANATWTASAPGGPTCSATRSRASPRPLPTSEDASST
jgi:hypothetical protein